MKVLLVGDYPPPVGGIAVHLAQLHRFLGSQGVESKVLNIGKGRHQESGVVAPSSSRDYLAFLSRFAREDWLIHLHVSGNNAKAWAVVGSVRAVRPRMPPVVTIHSGLSPGFLAGSALRRLGAKMALSRYGSIIAVSESIKAALLQLPISKSRIAVHPAFCSSELRPGPLPESFLSFRKQRYPLLAMADSPSPVYGRELMLEALARLVERMPRVGLAAFGPGSDSPELEKATRQGRVEGRVRGLGALPHPVALGVISACDAFIRPTLADGDSLSVREALALGIPCVASDAAVRPRGATLFRSGNPEDLAAKIEQALNSQRVPAASVDVGPALLALYTKLSQDWRGSSRRAARWRRTDASDARSGTNSLGSF